MNTGGERQDALAVMVAVFCRSLFPGELSYEGQPSVPSE